MYNVYAWKNVQKVHHLPDKKRMNVTTFFQLFMNLQTIVITVLTYENFNFQFCKKHYTMLKRCKRFHLIFIIDFYEN